MVTTVPALLDFSSRLFHTVFTTDRSSFQMDQQYLNELKQKHIKNPPEGMTPQTCQKHD